MYTGEKTPALMRNELTDFIDLAGELHVAKMCTHKNLERVQADTHQTRIVKICHQMHMDYFAVSLNRS